MMRKEQDTLIFNLELEIHLITNKDNRLQTKYNFDNLIIPKLEKIELKNDICELRQLNIQRYSNVNTRDETNQTSKNISSELNKVIPKNKFSFTCDDLNIMSCNCFQYLIVDDEPLCISYLLKVLREYSKEIKTAINGLEAVNKVKEMLLCKCSKQIKQFLIFMDLHMPIMNGIEASKLIDISIKENKNYNIDCKIIFISGNIDSQYTKELESISIYYKRYNKPIRKVDLLELIGVN